MAPLFKLEWHHDLQKKKKIASFLHNIFLLMKKLKYLVLHDVFLALLLKKKIPCQRSGKHYSINNKQSS